jgi:hypothetical protein
MADTFFTVLSKRLKLHDNADAGATFSPVVAQGAAGAAAWPVEGKAGGVPVGVREATAPAAAAHVNAPAANTAAVITLAATADKKHYVPRVAWSYDAVPTGGRLTITDDGTTVFDMSITADGPGVIDLGIESAAVNKAMVITLAAGGAAVTGKVNVPGARTE